ncbi:hypothetical protein VRU48_14835 [Pedobacter sp. KR3-3]|uniref:Uncharacterized protein n=1 Tax=Pedobacter albus TaxID=3113905 RepID=A0ABU7IA91_9SPHI|nr:hypothetical protein [Pedobacter sp. KR3-3]MEE1946397.1 hypothetical protein [Pedobacter sp. KR3-3]
MEIALQTDRPQTLVTELGNWNRLENQFRELFSEQALKDREFMKMKLGEYERLAYKYAGAPKTADERAMQVILNFQRTKMRRAIYPGILSRLVYRSLVLLRHALRPAPKVPAGSNDPAGYIHTAISVPEGQQTPPTEKQEQVRSWPRFGQDLGGRKPDRHQNKGQSL